MMPTSKDTARPTVFLAAEIGIGIRYFCQTRLLRELVDRGVQPVVLVPNPDEVRELLRADLPTVAVEKLRVDHIDHAFATSTLRSFQLRALIFTAVNHLRITGMSRRMNLAVPRDYRWITERQWKKKRSRLRYLIGPLAAAAAALRRSKSARQGFERLLTRRPIDHFHDAAFDKYSPSLVVASSPGWWPGEEMIFREAKTRGIRTLGVVAGWDHPCSKGLPGARPDRMVAWSEVHRQELILGSDFNEKAVDISGPAHFDFYRAPNSAEPRESYLKGLNLDPQRRLITFGCTFVGLSPNLIIVQALAEAMARGEFDVPVQLLVRLHPSHLKAAVGKYRAIRQEGEQFYALAEKFPNVHIDSPVLGNQGIANYTAPADARSLASLFAHSDVFVTLFSTMVLESCFNDVPVVAAAFDPPASGLEDFLPISKALDWPTHDRIIRSGAAAVVRDPAALVSAVRRYLKEPKLHSPERRLFAEQECTYLDGRCGARLADLIDRQAREATSHAAARPLRRVHVSQGEGSGRKVVSK